MTRGTRPSRRRLRNAVAVAGLAIVAIGAMSPGAASRTSVVRHQGLPVSARPDRVLGPTPPAERIEFDLILRYRRRALRRFTTGVNDPASPDYHRYASAAELGRRFGVSSHELDRVRLWLREHGLDVVADYPQRTAFRVAGPTSLVDHALGVTMVDRRDRRTGVRYHQPRGPARVPMELTGTVALVDGLDTKPRFYRRPLAAPRQAGTHCADTPSCLTIDKLNRAFAITPLHDRGFRGEGQYVAVVMDGKVSQSDLDAFSAASGLTDVPPIETITVGAGPTAEELADPIGRYEATMDVETVQAIAPRARLLYFFAALQNFRGAIDAVVADGRAKIVTFSAGACDNGHSRGADDTALEAANGHGINVFASSGDAGAFTCLQGNPNDFRPFATDPADSPFVTGVGGTFLRYTANGTYVDETVWAGPLDNSGTGGGLAFAPQRPAWQRAPGVDNAYSNGKRQMPDVSAPADPNSGWIFVLNGQEQFAGGTSASSPFWAGLTALLQQMVLADGQKELGFLNPTLYALARTNPPNTIFHDIVRGDNLYYPATPGWDFATGLGSPIASRLGDAIVAYLSANTTAA